MRIIAGQLGGREFRSPAGHRTHPMSDKIRGAIFNILGDVSGLSLLDAFAGSGALSLEAVSRGAAAAVAIDVDKAAAQTAADNARSLGVDNKIKVIRANAAGWSENNPAASFDLVICDPPYDKVKPDLLARLAGHVKPGGVVVLSLPPTAGAELPEPVFQRLLSKSYGDASLAFYRRAPDAGN